MATLADLLTSKIPPHNLEAEHAVLGALLLERDAWPRILDHLGADDFYKESHRKIFAAMARTVEAAQGVDLVTLSEALRQADALEEIGGPAYLGMLLENAALLTRLDDYAAIVRDKAQLRELIRYGTETIGAAYANGHPPAELLTRATAQLEALTRRATPPATAFPALSIDELRRTPTADPSFHVHAWIPAAALTFIVGDSEACKSWFSLLLAMCVAAGKPLLDTFPVMQAPALVISEENGLAEDKRRIELLCRGLDLETASVPCFLASDTHFSFDDPVRYAALRAYIAAHGIRLVLIDSFIRVHRRKENDAGEMSALYLDRMKPLIEGGVALVLLHHRRKAQAGPGQGAPTTDSDEIRGSGDLRAATHSVLFLRTVSDTQVLVKHNKTRGFKRQEPYVFSIADTDQGGVTLTFEGRPEDALDKSGGCREAILLYAAEKGAFARRDLGAAFRGKFGKRVFDPVLKALSATGTPLRLEHRGPRHAAWYVYVPQGLDAPTAQESDDAELPF